VRELDEWMGDRRPVWGFEGRYEVTERGEVFSLVGWREPRQLKPATLKGGHLIVQLRDKDGQAWGRLVHRLVAEAFIPNPEGHPAVLHRDGNPRNNAAPNLYWGTQADNAEDALRHETIARGSRSGMAKLNEAKVMNMRNEYRLLGIPCRILGEMYGVTESTARKAVSGRTWAHVLGAVNFNIKD
jgi:hypothetical protein